MSNLRIFQDEHFATRHVCLQDDVGAWVEINPPLNHAQTEIKLIKVNSPRTNKQNGSGYLAFNHKLTYQLSLTVTVPSVLL